MQQEFLNTLIRMIWIRFLMQKLHLIERYTESHLNQLINMYALGHAINGP